MYCKSCEKKMKNHLVPRDFINKKEIIEDFYKLYGMFMYENGKPVSVEYTPRAVRLSSEDNSLRGRASLLQDLVYKSYFNKVVKVWNDPTTGDLIAEIILSIEDDMDDVESYTTSSNVLADLIANPLVQETTTPTIEKIKEEKEVSNEEE